MVYQFITTPPVSDYFSDLVLYLRKRCFHLDKIVHDKKEAWNLERSKLVLESDEITNDLYYFQDMLSVGEPRLSKIVTQNIFSLLVFPTLLPSLYLRDTNDMNKCISATTSLYLLSQIIQIIKGTNIIHFICALFLYIPIVSSMKESMESVAADTTNQTHVFERYVSELDQTVQLQCDGANDIRRNLLLKQLLECMSSNSGFISFSPGNMLQKSDEIIHNVCSNSHCLMLASLMLLVGLLESKDIDPELAAITAIPEIKSRIRKMLLEILASRTSVQLQLEAAWVLRRLLLVSVDKNLEDNELQLFKTSCELSTEHLKKELDGCWFDYIQDTLKNEWTSCKKALEQPLQSKDPFFVLELSFGQNTTSICPTSALAWQHMVDAVKGFIIHHQLKSYIFSGYSFDNALANLKDSFSRETNGSDLSRGSFGSELSLGSAIPCKIAFSKTGTRDVYMMPLATGKSGKLILLEPHPLYSRKGVVIAIAPLAGLNLSIVENQPTWLLLRLRDTKPRFSSIQTRGHDSSPCIREPGNRWILRFPDAQVCNTAYAMVLKEISKQRSVAEGMLTRFLQNIPS